MHILIVNELDHDVVVTVVEHSPLSIEFMISMGRVPIPVGYVSRRETLEPGQIFGMFNIPKNARPSMRQRNMGGPVSIFRKRGTAKDGSLYVELTLKPKNPDAPPPSGATRG